MKVLYLAPRPGREGPFTAYSFLDEEISALAAAGIRAYVLLRRAKTVQEVDGVVRWPMPRERSLRDRGGSIGFLLKTSPVVAPGNLVALGGLYHAARIEKVAAELVRREGVELVHSHFAWPDGLGGTLVARATNVPLVACLRGADILVDPEIGYGARKRAFFDRNLRQLLRLADRTLYFSAFMQNEAIRLGARPERARTVDKAVDLSQFGVIENRVAVRRQLGFGDRPMILTVGGLIRRKGIDLILEALARLRNRFDFSFVVCGEGPERNALEALAQRLSLEDRTYFMGQVSREQIPTFFGACDIFVLASVLEAAGNVLFEAMGSGRPIVCTRSGGPGEYVEDGVSGFVVPVSNSEALAERIAALLSDPALGDRMGQEGLRAARTRYAYPRLVRDILAVYEEALRERRGSGRRRAAAAV